MAAEMQCTFAAIKVLYSNYTSVLTPSAITEEKTPGL